MELSEAAQNLAREYDLSLRQAYRYLEEAARLGQAVEVTEATVPITLKLPPVEVEGPTSSQVAYGGFRCTVDAEGRGSLGAGT